MGEKAHHPITERKHQQGTKKKPAPRNKPCSLLLHEVRSLFNEVSSLTKEWPPHRPRRQPSPAVSYLIPFQESKADR